MKRAKFIVDEMLNVMIIFNILTIRKFEMNTNLGTRIYKRYKQIIGALP